MKRYIGFQSIVVFYNNKPGINHLSLNLWLIFDPKSISFEHGFATHCLEATLANWKLENNVLIGQLQDGSSFQMSSIDDQVNASKFDAWFKEFINRPNWMVEMSLLTDKIGYTRRLRNFYQT